MPENRITTNPAAIGPHDVIIRDSRLPLVVRPASSQAGLTSFRGGTLRVLPPRR